MRLPEKYSNLLFGGLMSTIMVTIVSGTVLLVNQGLTANFPLQWLKGFTTAWPIAFPTVVVVAPRVCSLVAKLTTHAA